MTERGGSPLKKHLHTIYFATINGMTTVITIVSLLFIYVFIGVFNDGQVSSGKWDSILPIILLICLLEVCKWVSFGFIIVHKYPFIIFYFFYVSFIVYLSFHGMLWKDCCSASSPYHLHSYQAMPIK